MAHKETVYRLEGLSCANCAAKFEDNIRNIDTVKDVKLNFGAAKVTVIGDVSIAELEAAGAFDGIKVYPDEGRPIEKRQPFYKKHENIAAMISLVFTTLGYLAFFQFGEAHLLTIGLFATAIVIGGYDLFKVGVKNLVKLEFDMKTLMTIAIIGAALIGEWAEGAVVVFLFALSEALEAYSMDKARSSIRSLMDMAPDQATIRRGSHTMVLPVEDIQIGDVMIIKPGEKIAMDGVVIKGESAVNEAAITGESIPQFKTVGSEIFAGSINEEGSLEVQVTKRVEDTTIAKIIHLVEEAQAERAPSQRFVDQFAKYYTPAIMVIALLVATIPPLLFDASWSKWVYLGLAVLVVGCPCALIISTPVAIVTAIGHAAKKGVLIKGGVHLEETGRLQVIAFDKTGTLTEGRPKVTDIVPVSELDEHQLLAIARAIEAHSQHPLASAICHEAEHRDAMLYEATEFHSLTGKGAKATVQDIEYYIGSPTLFADELKLDLTNVNHHIKHLQQQGKTVMLLGTDKAVKGILAVRDQIRSSSQDMIRKLHDLGIKQTMMLTGDNRLVAEQIARELGVTDFQAELMPDEKLRAIVTLEAKYGKVAMVGDGVNDAPALARATVGIAMGGAGTDAALETADIALMADDLEKLPYTIALSRKALRIIKENISFSFAVKLLALLLVIPGWLTLWIAIFADVGATLLVVLNSMRLMKTTI